MVLLVGSVFAGRYETAVAMLLLSTTVFALFHEEILKWQNLLAAIIAVILFIPLRRYTLAVNLPFQLEPYRVAILIVALLWFASLLIDPAVRLRRSILDAPLMIVVLIAFASIAVNTGRVTSQNLGSTALKSVTFLLSFAIVFHFITSTLDDLEGVQKVLKFLVGGGTVVAVGALIELWTGYNIFNSLPRLIPVLREINTAAAQQVEALNRGSYKRVFASAQHPIALGSLFVVLIPQAIYVARATKQRVWILCAAVLFIATFGTVSRTSMLGLIVVCAVFVAVRPRETLRYWPAILPLLAAVHFAMPGVLGTFYKSFFPKQGLVAEQADGQVGSSRVASLGPGLQVVNLHPVLGVGYGTRIPQGQPGANSFIVDDQWLSTAMETGALGVLAWVWLLTRFLRRIFRASRRAHGDEALLFTAIGASVVAYAVGMLTYDAFSFIQVTIVFFILLALGCVALRSASSGEQHPGLAAADRVPGDELVTVA